MNKPKCKACGAEHLSIRKGKLVMLDKDGLCYLCRPIVKDEP